MPTDEWTVEVTYSLGAQLEDKQIDMLSDHLEDLDWTVAQLPDGYLSIFGGSEDDEDPLDATSRVVDIAKRTLDDLDIHGNLQRVVISSHGWREKKAVDPALPELLAAKDISKTLGVSRQRVSQLQREHPQFPAPVMHTGAGSLWTRSAVDWFASIWDRRPGRRAASAHETEDAEVVSMVELRPCASRSWTRKSEDDTARKACQERVKA